MRTTKVMFLDDSDRPKNNVKVVAVGGVVLDTGAIHQLAVGLAHWREAHGIPEDAELKWSPDRDSWIRKNLTAAQRVRFYGELIPILQGLGGLVMIAAVDCSTLGWTAFRAKLECTQWLAERFEMHLEQPAVDGVGIVVIDHFASHREDQDLEEAFNAWCRHGTQYVDLHRVVMNAMLAPSHFNSGIQFADLIVGATAQICDTHPGLAQSVWPSIRGLLYANREGLKAGCGLKVWPPERAKQVYETLLEERSGASLEEEDEDETMDNAELRYMYSQVLSPEELDAYFP